MMFGTSPPEGVIEDRPEGTSPQIAVETWIAGYQDGHQEKSYHFFTDRDLQPLYDSGYEQGERERSIRKEIYERPGAQNEPTEEANWAKPTEEETFSSIKKVMNAIDEQIASSPEPEHFTRLERLRADFEDWRGCRDNVALVSLCVAVASLGVAVGLAKLGRR